MYVWYQHFCSGAVLTYTFNVSVIKHHPRGDRFLWY